MAKKGKARIGDEEKDNVGVIYGGDVGGIYGDDGSINDSPDSGPNNDNPNNGSIKDNPNDEHANTNSHDAPHDDQLNIIILDQPRPSTKDETIASNLPDWLARPIHIAASSDGELCMAMNQCSLLEDRIMAVLREESDIEELFPVQQAVLQYTSGEKSHDLCIAAPTGSGKTLAYILPIIQGLIGGGRRRRGTQLRALIVVPGRELAMQVQTVMEPFARQLGLQVGLAIGQTPLGTEQKKLMKDGGGLDVLIATPGRLMDHLESTKGFSLQHVEWLVLDEADRLLEGVTQDWLGATLHALDPWQEREGKGFHQSAKDNAGEIYTFRRARNAPYYGPMWTTPLRKMLLSATLTRNPAKLAQLRLRDPLYLLVSNDTTGNLRCSTPRELSQYLYVCEEERKPAVLLYLLQSLDLTRTLCFAKSIEGAERLAVVLRRCTSKHISLFTADASAERRAACLRSFNDGDVDLLICSDAAARGLDLANVTAVINYDTPRFLKTYIHRVGRTARAGKSGLAYTILAVREAYHFKQLFRKVNLPLPTALPKMNLYEFVRLVRVALAELREECPDERRDILDEFYKLYQAK